MLVLDAPPVRLTRRYLHGDLSAGEIDTHPVLARWARAQRLGLSVESAAFPEGTTARELVERRERLVDRLREQRGLIDGLGERLAGRSSLVLLADAEGVVLEVRGAGEFLAEAARVRLVEGARWDEATRGTNAIGTALREGKAVGVIGGAHFEARNHELFCYATPLRDVRGEVVGVLDVTGAASQHDAALSRAVQEAGARFEQAMRQAAFASSALTSLAVLERLIQRCVTPSFLVEASDAVHLVNEAARAVLGLEPGRGGLTAPRIMGVGFAELFALAQSQQQLCFETTGGQHRVQLDPILDAAGRALAVLVHLEPRLSAPPSRPAAVAPVRASAVPTAFLEIVGSDDAVVQARARAAHLASTDLPVLLLAETGTGKDVFARAIHAASARRDRPFVAINCGALSAALLESELFGHAPGAFTGATRGGMEGKLGAANGGTLFLDEIAEMPEALQAALLRVLDDGSYYRLGDPRERRVDLRLVAATCRDLPAMVERGAFRRDLFYRIHGACVTLPRLRERSDRVELAQALLARLDPSRWLGPSALSWIREHDWPGNVRELKSALRHAVAVGPEARLEREHFPIPLLSTTPRPGPATALAGGETATRTRQTILRDAVRETVEACTGNISEAARRLGVARSTIYRMMAGRSEP